MNIKKILSGWKAACLYTGVALSGSINAETTLNLAVVYAPGSIPGSSATDYVNELIEKANGQYSKSRIDVVFNPVVIAPLRQDKESLISTNNTTLRNFETSYMDLANLTGQQGPSLYIDSTQTSRVHQVVLLLPNTTPLECGVALALPGEVKMFSIVRSQCRNDELVLAHELAHNLGAADSTPTSGQGVESCWGIEDTQCWRSVMIKGKDYRQYFTNPEIYDPATCGVNFNNGYCGDATHNNAAIISSHLAEANLMFCDITAGSSNCIHIESDSVNPPDLEIGFARYEYGNCVSTSRHGTVEWDNVADANHYIVQYQVGANWYTLYSGPNTQAAYNTTATNKTHYFKVQASADNNVGSWKSFSGFVPRCSSGGGGPIIR